MHRTQNTPRSAHLPDFGDSDASLFLTEGEGDKVRPLSARTPESVLGFWVPCVMHGPRSSGGLLVYLLLPPRGQKVRSSDERRRSASRPPPCRPANVMPCLRRPGLVGRPDSKQTLTRLSCDEHELRIFRACGRTILIRCLAETQLSTVSVATRTRTLLCLPGCRKTRRRVEWSLVS